MKIKIISGEVNLYEESPQIHVLDFGTVKQHSDVKVTVEVEGITSSTLSSTCRCTAANSERLNVFNIRYDDNHVIGAFSKTLLLTYFVNGHQFTSYIKIKGNVIQ